MAHVQLTVAQALVRYLMAQQVELDGQLQPLIPAVWAIFGHGNVAGLGEALYQVREQLPTLRAHNEQGMAHSAIAYAKAKDRQQCMACTTSIGPGATNMVTAAALAHVNRLPVLFLPGDTFANRLPDPVLQQLEDASDPTITVNDCFRPVSRYWDRITHPAQLLSSLPRAISVLTDPADCGPVTLALPQDVQAMAYEYPEQFFAPKVHYLRRPGLDSRQLDTAVEHLKRAEKPFIIAGGGVHYSLARKQLKQFAETYDIPVAETQAGKGALAWDHPCQAGSIGVTGSSAANELAAQADVILAVGTRLQDFTTASRSLFANPEAVMIGLNVSAFDAGKHNALPLVGDALTGLKALHKKLKTTQWRAPLLWRAELDTAVKMWQVAVAAATARANNELPSDAEVIGAVNRAADDSAIVVCAAGGLPGELHKLWRTQSGKGYHLEYGYSCMGYEIAGGLGVKMAQPDRDVYVMVGDGSYMMLNSEIATSIMLGYKLTIVVLDNRGFACINRLQQACGGAAFNNLLRDAKQGADGVVPIDFAAHAAAMGADAQHVSNLDELGAALVSAKQSAKTSVIVIDTDPSVTTQHGGAWWDVPVAEVSERTEVLVAHSHYIAAKQKQQS